MHEDVIAALVRERFGQRPTPPPIAIREPDNIETWTRRQQVLAEMPGDEWPGEEAA
ncbi:MAG TPA: hypothetical protein VGF45_03135 [Polyangia bacterium]